jgi:Tol biopolymer transport system component
LAQFPPTNPGWSPDGRHLGFSTAGEAGGTIYIADADGSNVFALTDGFEPCWSPDGSKIAFTSQDVRDEDRDIYVIGIDGSGRKRITSDRAVEWNPAWQP